MAHITGQTVKTVNNHEGGNKIPASKIKMYEKTFMDAMRERELVKEIPSNYICLSNELFSNPDQLAQLTRFLVRNHERLIKDDIYGMYYEKIKMEFQSDSDEIAKLLRQKLTETKIGQIKDILISGNEQKDED